MGHYRRSQYNMFFSLLEEIEKNASITSYQLAMKANVLLLSGRYKESLAIFSVLSSDVDEDIDDIRYIAIYSRAMIEDINGNVREFQRISQLASTVPAKRMIKRNLPLNYK